ncbi:hypothetical protein Pmani_029686 [Petrolisthes manimaculis]|uniref:Uncharacterized protein n=1 Tax=Petrolisthes manimaculis TaxID=1843537 RepID=A0AAE1NXI7_9EUCA|nr:hypothetical protein Pmani_029686 [Petrolisthes manimaculis]
MRTQTNPAGCLRGRVEEEVAAMTVYESWERWQEQGGVSSTIITTNQPACQTHLYILFSIIPIPYHFAFTPSEHAPGI